MTPFSLVYDICLHAYILAACLNFRKYKNIFLKRLGKDFPVIEKKNRPLIWIHAVSVGETKAVAPLIKRLKSTANTPCILLSTVTETGHETGLKSAPEADYHVYLPLDFSYIIRPIMKRVAPDIVILTETDFWFHFQDAAKKSGAELIVINGKVSERSFNRLLKLPTLRKYLLYPIDHFYVQGELYRSRFEKLGIAPSHLTVTGNLKLDGEIEQEDVSLLKDQLGLSGKRVLTLGSTHDPEERLWIDALKQLWLHFPDLKVLIVPRHPERFNEVAHLLESESLSFSRWSDRGTLHGHDILLVDAMGVLRKCYQLSDLAFVGGSFTPKVGGHNILEPSFYGKPVLFGPYMHSQPDFLDLAKAYKAGIQIDSGEIASTVHRLFSSPSEAQELGANGRKLIKESSGALYETCSRVLHLLQKRGSC